MRYALVFLALACSGCELLKSRYAMDDTVYASKYADGAEQGDLVGKAKQALDARHTSGLSGIYLSGGAQVRPSSGRAMAGGEVGGEAYATSWCSGRAGLAGYYGDDEGYLGCDAGLRLQTPTRLAPFVGVGAVVGVSRGVEQVADDGLDNDDDMWIDEADERETSTIDSMLTAVYPEVGAHFWIDGNWRVTTFGRYLVTSFGRDSDDWLLGLQVTRFGR